MESPACLALCHFMITHSIWQHWIKYDRSWKATQTISKEISKLKSDKGHILQVLKDGSEKAEAIASEKVKKIKEIIGF